MAAPRNHRAPTPHHLGRLGEALAAAHLEQRGWTILDHGFRLGHREIDLIAQRDDVIAFIEVKTRAGLGFGHPLESITRRKRADIERVARAWIARYGRDTHTYRFDAVGIVWPSGEEPVIEYVEDAWRGGRR